MPASSGSGLTEAGIIDMIRKKMMQSSKTGGMQARKQFKHFDRDGSGSITKSEFIEALAKWGIELTEDTIKPLFDKFDPDGSGEIQYGEFVSHVMDHGDTSVQIGALQKAFICYMMAFNRSEPGSFAFAKSANMLDNGSRPELPNTCYMAKSKRPGDPTAWGEAVPMNVEGSRAGPHYAGVRAER